MVKLYYYYGGWGGGGVVEGRWRNIIHKLQGVSKTVNILFLTISPLSRHIEWSKIV